MWNYKNNKIDDSKIKELKKVIEELI